MKKTKLLIKTEKKWSYADIVRSWHKEEPAFVKKNPKKRMLNFLFKISVVFLASFLTTLAFSILMSPNGIYNSGLNGILQTFFSWLSGNQDIVREHLKMFIFGTALIINTFIILFLGIFFRADWEMMSTAFFYSGFQLFWNWIFERFHWNEYLFSNLIPENWNYWISQKQLGFTLPFYIAIAIGAAIIHTYGYSLIFQARATPGGLEIITSHLSARKKKTSISFLFKLFGFLIIFFITVTNFIWIDDSVKVKKAELKTYLLKVSEKLPEEKKFIQKNNDVEWVLTKWKEDWQKKKTLEKVNKKLEKNPESKEENQAKISQNQEEINEIERRNSTLTELLKKKLGNDYLDEYPEKEIDSYLTTKEKLVPILKEEISKKEQEFLNSLSKKDRKKKYLEYLKIKLERIEKENYEKNILGYFKYVTNNERLWATIVYVFFSSLLINQMFPKDVKVILNVQTDSRDKLNRILSLLREFSPFYYATTSYEAKRPGEEKTIYVINCSLSKWRYYLLQEELKYLNVMYFINERS